MQYYGKYVLNMSCKNTSNCIYAKYMALALDAITRWHYYIHTCSSIIFVVTVLWDALLRELANKSCLISLTGFCSCDRELPGEGAVVLEIICRLFVIISLRRFVVQTKLLYWKSDQGTFPRHDGITFSEPDLWISMCEGELVCLLTHTGLCTARATCIFTKNFLMLDARFYFWFLRTISMCVEFPWKSVGMSLYRQSWRNGFC